MKLAGSDRSFLVKKAEAPIDLDWQFYEVEERESERLLRTFTAKVSQSQVARPRVKEDIARSCELYPEKLPSEGGVVRIDLDYVQKF